MMYEGAIRFLERSLVGFNEETELNLRNQTISNNLIRAQAIITELDVRLDMERGGEVAQNFRQLYSYYNRRLLEANRRKTPEPIEEVLRLVRILRDSWAEMIQRGDSEPTAAMTPPPRPRTLESA
jgi:flagellar protein FliS